ncbi:MAG: hypothetical protein PHN49_08865 [Candidatus Omnitrophica bacterium]|nr:hypothetical protein [Candidatus Omnitrophota bacterium]MDD5671736.1 hypothetical protein [Candidatus Omnitrophota bacterium]
MIHEHQILKDLEIKLVRNHLGTIRQHSLLKILFCSFMLIFMGVGAFAFFKIAFHFLHTFTLVGPFLADRFVSIFTYCLFILLLTSSTVTAYMVFYKSDDNQLLFTLPVSWEALWTKKLCEIFALSAWAFLFLVIPFLAAYGHFKGAPADFYLLAPVYYLALAWNACAIGALITLLFFFVVRKAALRKWILWAAGIALLVSLIHMRPDLREEPLSSPAELFNRILPHFKWSFAPFFPHAWTSDSITALRHHHFSDALFNAFLLIANGLFFFQIGFLTAPLLYRQSRLFLTEDKTRRHRGTKGLPVLDTLLRWLPRLNNAERALIAKDIRLFVRDPVQWSQFLIFFGVLAIYFANLRTFKYDLLIPYWKHFIFAANIAALLMTAAGLNGRFAFPLFSLEGNRFWIVGLSPLSMKKILIEKFKLWFCINLAVLWGLTFLSAAMLRISPALTAAMLVLTGLASFALTGLSIGMGAIFPNFKTDNPVKIVSGFSGTLNFILEFCYIFLATGIAVFLTHSLSGITRAAQVWDMNSNIAGLVLMMVGISLAYGFVPLWVAGQKLAEMEY